MTYCSLCPRLAKDSAIWGNNPLKVVSSSTASLRFSALAIETTIVSSGTAVLLLNTCKQPNHTLPSMSSIQLNEIRYYSMGRCCMSTKIYIYQGLGLKPLTLCKLLPEFVVKKGALAGQSVPCWRRDAPSKWNHAYPRSRHHLLLCNQSQRAELGTRLRSRDDGDWEAYRFRS